MENKIFGNMFYDEGFKTEINITIFDLLLPVKVYVMAYYENDGITAEQEQSFLKFKENSTKVIAQVEGGLLGRYENADERFALKMMMIDRQGELAFLFDDKEDEDDGIAVQVYPTYLIDSQDNYL